jgi:ferric-dicitrate binding protein FerR (iron transport regulator)
MEVDSDKTPEGAMLDQLAQLASRAIPPMTPPRQQRGFAAVSARLAARHGQRRRRFQLELVALGAGAAACALWLVLATRAKPPASGVITYRIEAGEILAGGYLRSFGDRGMTLRFSEGTKLALLPGARGRLQSVDEKGARLAIEQGPARIEVSNRPGAHWLVDAGPFLITVKGTVFTVGWNAKNEQLDLRMEKGLVSITGPILENVILVRSGQQLAINLPKKEVVLHEIDSDRERLATKAGELPSATASEPALAPPPAAPPARSAALPGRASQRAGTRAHSPVSYGWAAALAAGEVDSILGDVERLGLKRSLGEASSDDLSALADAARYRRQQDIARQSLLAQRSRFPGSGRACDAAFLLGRLEESNEGGGPKALEWYDQYLEGAPTGAYASEALGRKMIATQKLMGGKAARAVAQEYLERFPTGAYAGAARALRQTP